LEKQSVVNREIDDEIQALEDSGQQRKFGGKVSITPSRTVILRENMIKIVVVLHREVWLSLLTDREASIWRLDNDRLPIQARIAQLNAVCRLAEVEVTNSTFPAKYTDHRHNPI
jgi:hypothetical protein